MDESGLDYEFQKTPSRMNIIVDGQVIWNFSTSGTSKEPAFKGLKSAIRRLQK